MLLSKTCWVYYSLRLRYLHLKIELDYTTRCKYLCGFLRGCKFNRLHFYYFRNSLSNIYPFNKLHVIPLHYIFNYYAPRHLHVFRALMRVAGNWVPYSSWNFTVWLASGHSLLLRPPLQARLQYIRKCGASLCHVLQAFDNTLCNLDFSFPTPYIVTVYRFIAMSRWPWTTICVVGQTCIEHEVNGVQLCTTPRTLIFQYIDNMNSKIVWIFTNKKKVQNYSIKI